MRKLLPSSKRYTLALCLILLVAAFFIPVYTNSRDAGYSPLSVIRDLFREASASESDAALHTLLGRPIVERDGKLLVWAEGNPYTDDARWLDLTDSTIDPRNFNHGVGIDRIPSIDAPEFVDADDPRLAEAKITKTTPVIGYEVDGVAKAYPIAIMHRHEIVNDVFGDAHITVAW